MPVVIKEQLLEEPDSQFPKLPSLPASLSQQPGVTEWYAQLHGWYRDLIQAVKRQSNQDNP